MNPITDLWRQLVRRRLWPVALLLVGAIAAVPVLMAKDPEATEPATSSVANVPVDDVTASLTTEPIVSLDETGDKKRRAPLGGKKDIFKPTKKAPKPAKAEKTEVEKPATPTAEEPAKDPSPSSGGGTTTPAPVETDKPEAPKTYPAGSLLVRLNGKKSIVEKREALSSDGSPLMVYLGLTDRGKTAVFLLDSTLKPQGDGKCEPTPENCEKLHLRVGETEFLDTVDETGAGSGVGFQLDLVKIHKPKSSSQGDDSAGRTAGVGHVTGTVASLRLATTATRTR